MKRFEIIEKAQFDISGINKIIALFFNPFFFVRKGLYKGISRYSKHLSGKLLDFGCGAAPYRRLFSECEQYIGLDTNQSGHDHSEEIIDVIYDGKNIPFADEEFDSVFTSEVFEHVEDVEHAIKEINRVLKKDGLMLLTVPFIWNEHELPYDFRRYTCRGVIKTLRKNGFRVIKANKSTSYVEMIFQMLIEYLRIELLERTDNGIIKMVIQLFLLAPITALGCMLSFLLPRGWSFYGDCIVLCRKDN